MIAKRLTLKILLASFIFGWWFLAFHKPGAEEEVPKTYHQDIDRSYPVHFQNSYLIKPTSRDLIQKALSGDVSLMISLIQKWDIDAKIMKKNGFTEAKKLSSDQFIKCQMIGRALTNDDENLDIIDPPHLIVDEALMPFDINKERKKFLPQTWGSCGILLALLDPDQIIALPNGLRKQTAIYDPQIIEMISLDCDTSNLELLSLTPPDLTFASSVYSNPTTIDFLKSIGSEVFFTKNISDIDDIKQSISEIGWISDCPLKAELLNIFIDAALKAIDNWRSLSNLPEENILVASYFTQFSTPGNKSLTYALMKRMGIENFYIQQRSKKWLIPITEEAIVSFNPDRIILLADSSQAVNDILTRSDALKCTNAYQKNQILYVPEDIQMTPSQFLVLAYYDLNAACSWKKP